MIKGIIFDFDDTLYSYHDSNNFATESLYEVISTQHNIDKKLVIQTFAEVSASNRIKNNTSSKFNKSIYIKQLVERLKLPLKFILVYLQLYNDCFFEKFKLFDGVEELFVLLKEKNIKIGILTNNVFIQQLEKMQRSCILEYVDFIQTSDECGDEKPDIKMFQMIQGKMNIPYENLVYMGDRYEHDIEPTMKLGMLPIWFNPGFKLQLCDNYIKTGRYSDVTTFIKSFSKTTTELVSLSKLFGQSITNIQGPGGNISVKQDDILFIKSSGSILGNMSYDTGYCMVDNKKCIQMVELNVDKIKSAKVFGYKTPSMETYFHSFMKKYCIHLHFTLSNVVFCKEIPDELIGFDIPYKIIDYFTPGLELAHQIYKKYDNSCDIYFLRNHGVIITSDNMDQVISYYEYIFEHFNSLLNTRYNYELNAFNISKTLHANNKSVVVRRLDVSYEIMKNIVFCFPDLAVFIQNKTEIQDISDLITDDVSYDIILYKNEVYGIAESLIKLYSLMEIVESYKMLHQETGGKIISIENPTVLCNMEQEKSRRL
jgi:putative hydrolase of the HAD superfamily